MSVSVFSVNNNNENKGCLQNKYLLIAHCYHDLGLKQTDLKINTGHLLVINKLCNKFGEPGLKRSRVIDQRPISMLVTVTDL